MTARDRILARIGGQDTERPDGRELEAAFARLKERKDLLWYLEDLPHHWPAMADTPRAIHLITGPSRTADVEQTIQLGAHGPRQVDCVILDHQ